MVDTIEPKHRHYEEKPTVGQNQTPCWELLPSSAMDVRLNEPGLDQIYQDKQSGGRPSP